MVGARKRAWGIANSWNVERSLPGDDEVRMARIVERICWEFPEIPRSQLVAMIYGTEAGLGGASDGPDQGHDTASQKEGPSPAAP